MKILLLYLVLFLIGYASSAQQTIRLMHYNLLNYGVNTGGCNSTNNNVNDKNQYLYTILDYVNPHILSVNEINCSVQTYDEMLNGCLEVYMQGKFERIPKTCNATSPLSNMVYYRSDLLEFYDQDVIPTQVRDVNVVRFFYKSPDLSVTHDTTFITLFAAHLKAGTNWDDEEERADETGRVMQYLSQNPNLPNRVFLGDLNLYTADEAAFENLTEYSNAALRFHDPINEIGNWHNNGTYAGIHTQSTHTDQNCFISGGMDDRFDFILIDETIRNNSQKVGYIPGSYTAVGQDGQHFNKSLTDDPANGSVPSYVLDALYDMSDHLPVFCDLLFEGQLSTPEYFSGMELHIVNPVRDRLILHFSEEFKGILDLKIYGVTGILLMEQTLKTNTSRLVIPVDFLRAGIYYLRLQKGGSGVETLRFIVLN